MNQHPYLRAYMAGIVIPTLVLLVAVSAFIIARYVFAMPLAVERVIIFPLVFVPNIWGLWNILYVALLSHRPHTLGVFGALLPLILVPGGWLVTRLVAFPLPTFAPLALPFLIPVVMVVYYLIWKYLVGALNSIVGISE
ncbi:MAG TPA: hypothetical protein VEZ11_09345 [Thermoanaerobaculia bacterium]|nr:hypothetical protein [Thermoanaerobaculia bacterium]